MEVKIQSKKSIGSQYTADVLISDTNRKWAIGEKRTVSGNVSRETWNGKFKRFLLTIADMNKLKEEKFNEFKKSAELGIYAQEAHMFLLKNGYPESVSEKEIASLQSLADIPDTENLLAEARSIMERIRRSVSAGYISAKDLKDLRQTGNYELFEKDIDLFRKTIEDNFVKIPFSEKPEAGTVVSFEGGIYEVKSSYETTDGLPHPEFHIMERHYFMANLLNITSTEKGKEYYYKAKNIKENNRIIHVTSVNLNKYTADMQSILSAYPSDHYSGVDTDAASVSIKKGQIVYDSMQYMLYQMPEGYVFAEYDPCGNTLERWNLNNCFDLRITKLVEDIRLNSTMKSEAAEHNQEIDNSIIFIQKTA